MIVQELIRGSGTSQYSYCAFWKEGQPIAEMTARRLRQHPSDFGRASTYVETVECPPIVELSRRFLDDEHEPSAESQATVDGVIARQGWDIWEHSAHRVALAASLDTLGEVDSSVDDVLLDFYARMASEIAAFEISHVDASSSHDAAIRSVVVGTALYEPLIILLRRLAQEHASRDWAAEESWLPTEPPPVDDPEDA